MTNGTWRHMSCIDIDLQVFAVIPTPSGWKCAVVYRNRHLGDSQGHETVSIARTDFWKWQKL